MKTLLLKTTGLLVFGGCCAITIFLISSACYLLKNEPVKTSTGEFFMIGANFSLFIMASIITVVLYDKIVKKHPQTN